MDAWLRGMMVTPHWSATWINPPGWQLKNRTVEDDMWFCVTDGEFRVRLDDAESETQLRRGGMLLIPRGVRHSLRRVEGEGRLVSVHFRARVMDMADILPLIGLRGAYRSGQGMRLDRISQRIARESTHKPIGWQESFRAEVIRVLLHLLRHPSLSLTAWHESTRKDIPLAVQTHLRLQPALELGLARLGDPNLRITDLAHAIHVSEVYLRRLFKDHFGCSPGTWLRQRRIEQACRELLGSTRPIQQIAQRTGFRDVAFFYRVFRSIMGTTPSRYRDEPPM